MPRTRLVGTIAFGAAALLSLAGCKYSSTAPPLPIPCPSAAPTIAPGIVTEYGGLSPSAVPFDIVMGSDANMWFTEFGTNNIGRVTPSGVVTEFPLSELGALPEDIVAGPNGQLWFVENGTNRIGEITTAGVVTKFNVTGGAGPSGLAVDQNGLLWFGEFNRNAIGSITTSGAVNEYVDATYPNGKPDAVAIAPDNTVWFLDAGNNAVGHLTFPGGAPTFNEFALPTASAFPEFITVGSDGNLWLTEGAGRIARVIPGSGTVTEYVTPTQPNLCLPDGALPWGIVSSPHDSDIWFGEADAGQIGRITPGGVITEWGIPGAGTTAVGVGVGPDTTGGALTDIWFTDTQVDTNLPGGSIGTNQVGKINLSTLGAIAGRRTMQAQMQTYHLRPLPVHRRGP